jgi:hypothetical protein
MSLFETMGAVDPFAHWSAALRPLFSERRFLVAFDVAAGATGVARELRLLGSEPNLVVAGTRGAGPLPDPGDAHWLELGVTGATMMEAIHRTEAAFRALPPSVVHAIDAWDPDRAARAIVPIFSELTSVAGRAVLGARRPEWVALEDKLAVDAIWRDAGIERAPSAVVPAEEGALREAARALDQGDGTVWVADNRRGWHGGAERLWWVRSSEDAGRAAAALAGVAFRARVMPFLEGIPCSIHGWVLPTGDVLAFRPIEMVILRRKQGAPGVDPTRLLYARAASTWDPRSGDREALRATARAVGRWLRDNRGFRGMFTVDGVLGVDGFRPTELNPRFGGAVPLLTLGASLPPYLLHLASVEGAALDWRAPELEAAIVAWADGHRGALGGTVAGPGPITDEVLPVRIESEAVVPADGREAHGAISVGNAAAGRFVQVRFHAPFLEPGRPAAPWIARGLALADARWSLGLGPLEWAREVR